MKFIFEGTEITDATMSECGRFEVNPLEYYGIAYKIALLKELVKATAFDLICELSDKYGYKPMSLDEFQMEYKFNEEDTKNIFNLLKLFGL